MDIEYISLDDASDPAQTVTSFKKLISEEKVDAIIGPTGSPNSMSVLQFIAEAHTPMLAPVGAAGVVCLWMKIKNGHLRLLKTQT